MIDNFIKRFSEQNEDKKSLYFDSKNGIIKELQTGSTLEYRNGFYVLHLYGTPYERGYAHGKLFKKQIIESKIALYYGRLLEDLYESSDFYARLPKIVANTLEDLIKKIFCAPLEKIILDETKEELYGIADAVGFNRQIALRGFVAPDLMEFLAASFLKGKRESLYNYYLGGCSGLFVRKTALKKNQKALFARNMDFPGAVVWKYPAILFNHPTEEVDILVKNGDNRFEKVKKKKQDYMYISTAGFPGTGLTGYNKSGIAIGAFMCLSKALSKKLPLTMDYNHYLFTRAESIEGIIHLIKSENFRSASPHTALFADKEQAVSIEVDSKRAVIRSMDDDLDVHIQTNHFLSPITKRDEIEFPLEREHTVGRYRLLENAVEDNYGQIDVRRMIDLITSNLNLASGTTHLLGSDFPAQLITLTSAVFQMETGNFWVAEGRPPGLHYNRYVGFNFYDEINQDKRKRRVHTYKRSKKPVIRGTKFKIVTEKMKRSLWYVTLSQENLKLGKLNDAIKDMEQARRLYDDPGYRYIYGILLLMADRLEEALKVHKDLYTSFRFPPVKTSALILWIGRGYDLMGQRSKAISMYEEGLNDSAVVPHLKEVFEYSFKRPFTKEKLPKSIDYYLMGPLEFL